MKLLCTLLFICCTLSHAVRIKDISSIQGIRDNQLVGYGLVIGLAGTGDSSIDMTNKALSNALERFNITIPPSDISSKNVAAVMITADIGPFVKAGSRIDITVSSLGDASTIQGGVLLQTPLFGADDQVYAVAQGAIAIGGFFSGQGGEGGASVQQNHPTVGMMPNGAIVEREIPNESFARSSMGLSLRNPDFTTAVRTADAINKVYSGIAQAIDSGLVNVIIPSSFKGQEINFLAAIGQIDVEPDITARVIINERTGTIVATNNVRISSVAVSHGAITVTIANTQSASQPNAFGGGNTEVLEGTTIDVSEVKGGFNVIEEYPNIERLTGALNALGVTTREMMSILQALKDAGALQAELILN